MKPAGNRRRGPLRFAINSSCLVPGRTWATEDATAVSPFPRLHLASTPRLWLRFCIDFGRSLEMDVYCWLSLVFVKESSRPTPFSVALRLLRRGTAFFMHKYIPRPHGRPQLLSFHYEFGPARAVKLHMDDHMDRSAHHCRESVHIT